MSTVTEIENALEQLPVEQQQEVVEWLERRLAATVPSPAEVEDAWKKEIKCRINDIDNGRVVPRPASEVFARVRQLPVPGLFFRQGTSIL
ncbi:Putative addiction module component [Opitutaceae bacterium TAV1]|nr:Putative addiction module component [Opitutaceae bacterium TAV1]